MLLNLSRQVTSIRESAGREASNLKEKGEAEAMETLARMQLEELQDRNQ
jgi:F0F1-type ATP synthase membrane subunit b/b'